MKEVPLTQGMVALIDDEDYPEISRFRWCAAKTSRWSFYAHTWVGSDRKHVSMHRMIVNAPLGVEVDHIDGNGLNNQRINLRLATSRQQKMNRRRRQGISRYKGVTLDRSTGHWFARITVNGARLRLGSFLTEEEAARTYDKAALDHFGEFACVNFPA